MPILLSIVVCWGVTCTTIKPSPKVFGGIAGCQIEGEQQAALWAKEHPNGKVQAIRCTIGTERAQAAL